MTQSMQINSEATHCNTASMNVVVFGATQGTGRELVKLALDQGYTVTAFARTPERLGIKHDRLRVVKGDVEDYSAVKSAMHAQDAVFSALGAPALKATRVRSEGTRHMIQAMKEAGVERLISVSALGVGDSRESLPFFLKYIVLPFYLRRAYDDHELQEEYIRRSDLRWTIVRPPTLTDGDRTGNYLHGFPADDVSGVKLKISRADVADFMLKQLHDDAYISKTPGISY